MANGEDLFSLIQPQAPRGGIAGAFTSSVRGLSDFFAQATPQLIGSPDAGFGQTFASGLIGGLAGPQRAEEAQRSQQRQEGLQFALENFNLLDRETQEGVAQAIAPGVKLRPEVAPPSPEREALVQVLRDVSKNADEAPETRESAIQNLVALDPSLGDSIDLAIEETGIALEQGRLAFVSALAREYTPESLDAFLDTIPEGESILNGDFSKLELRGDVGGSGGSGGSPTESRDQQALMDFAQIEAEKRKAQAEGEELSDAQAMKRLDIQGLRASNVSRFMGVSTSDAGQISFRQLYGSAFSQILRDDFDIELSAFGTLAPKDAEDATKAALLIASAQVESLRRQGIPVAGPPEIVPRSAGGLGEVTLDPTAQPAPRNVRIKEEVERLQAAGDNRDRATIIREVAERISE